MKKKLIVIISLIGLALMFSATYADAHIKGETVYIEVQFPEPTITSSEYGEYGGRGMGMYSHVEMKDIPSFGHVGEPVLPVKGIKALIPLGRKVKDMDVILGEKVTLPGRYQIEPGQKQYPLSMIRDLKIKADKPKDAIYRSRKPYPVERKKYLSVNHKMGYPIAMATIFPVEYNPADGIISYYKKMTVVFKLEADTEKKATHQLKGMARIRMKDKMKERDWQKIRRLVDNKEDLTNYNLTAATTEEKVLSTPLPASELITIRGTSGATTQSALGPIPAGQYDYVIITDQGFASAFDPLKQRRIQKGLTANTVTTQWIYANYPGLRPDGKSDQQTQIRNFIIDAYNNWGTRYVLLGGDGDVANVGGESGNNIIPTRGLSDRTNADEGVTDDKIAADLYYACLTGTFDHNANGLYGEPTDGESGGDVNLLADVYVGRAPVDSVVEVNNFVSKTLAYEDRRDPYLKNNYLLGEYLGHGGISEYGTGCMEEIRWGTSTGGFTTQGFLSNPDRAMDTNTLYDSGFYYWPVTDLKNIMNNGVHIITHLGHANNTTVMKLTNADVDALTNSKYFIAYSHGCYAAAFDNSNPPPPFAKTPYNPNDSIAEHFVTSPNGAVAFIGNSRFGWSSHYTTAGSSQYFDRQFWNALFAEGMTELGQMNQDSKEDNLVYLDYRWNRWVYFDLNLLGDPALNVHVPSDLVMSVQPLVFIEKSGNGDGIFQTGETIEGTVSAKVLNQDAFNVYATLTSADPCITVLEGSANLVNLNKGAEWKIPVTLKLSANCTVGVSELSLTVGATGYTKQVKLLVARTDPHARKISSDPSSQKRNLVVDGDKIVWTARNETDRNDKWDISLYDLSTNTERLIITTNIKNFTPYPPSISGDKIVFEDLRNGNLDIYLYALSTNTERQITTDAANQRFPSISGDKIVWQDDRNGNRDIYLYDLSTNTERQITTDTTNQVFPAISGDKIVWQDFRENNLYIYLYDLSTNTERQLVTIDMQNYLDSPPSISGDKIVWVEFNGDIYLYDLSTNTLSLITNGALANGSLLYNNNPFISGDKVVWEDYRDFNAEIYLYDLTTKIKSLITIQLRDYHQPWKTEFFPQVSGDKSVWIDRNGNDIFLYTLSPIGTIVIDNGAVSTSTPVVNLQLQASGFQGKVISQMQFSNDNVTWSVPEPYATTKAWTLTSGFGTNTVYVKFKDVAGNWSNPVSDTIEFINAPPIITLIGDKVVVEGTLLQFNVTASDPNGQAVTLAATLDNGAALSTIGATFVDNKNGTGTFKWTPAVGQTITSAIIKFTATDIEGLTAIQNSIITVYRKAKIITPAAGTILNDTQTFTWDAGIGVTQYSLKVSYGATVIYGQELGTSRSAKVDNIPLNGQRVAVKLGSFINGTWYFSDYVYQVGKPAQILTPASGSVFYNSQTFTWDAGVGVAGYGLLVKTSGGTIYNQKLGTSKSATVPGIPMDGNQVEATLSSLINGTWYQVLFVWKTVLGLEMVTNGNFNLYSAPTILGWSVSGNWAYDATLKQLYINRASSTAQIAQSNPANPELAIQAKKSYQVEFDVKAYNGKFVAAGTYFTLGGNTVLIADVIGATSQYSKHYKVIIPATTTASFQFVVPANKLPSLAIDNVSVKEYRTPTPQPSPSPSPTASPNTAS